MSGLGFAHSRSAARSSLATTRGSQLSDVLHALCDLRAEAAAELLPMLESAPRVWNVLTAILDERSWADGQLGDFLHPERFPDWPERYRVQLRYRGFRRARLSDVRSNVDEDQRDELQAVGRSRRPVLVIWGKQDPNVPFELSASLMAVMPYARLLAVEQAGHLPQWEQPDIVQPAILSFLREVHR